MPLFPSLAKTEAFSNQQNAKSMSMSQPGFPPTAVQFYSTKSIDLTSNSITRDGNDNANDENDHNHDKASTSTSAPSFAPFTYQAVTIDTSTSAPASASASASTGRNDKKDGDTDSSGYSNPNLGIWNCKIHNANVSVDTNDSTNMNDNAKMNDNANTNTNTNMMPSELLKACLPTMDKIPTFILTLDLDEANLDQVHPIMSTMLKNIIAYCSAILERENNRVKTSTHNNGDNNGNDNSNSNGNGNGNGSEEKEEKFNSMQDISLSETESLPPQGTTNLIQLKTCIFGKAPLDESSFPHTIQELELDNEGSHSHSHSRSFNVNIIICGIFSQKTDVTATYREKQAINLLSYHLQKYAADLNCSLCFLKHKDRDNHKDGMGDDDDDEDDDNAHNDVEGNNDGDGKDNSDQGGGNAYRPSGMSVLELGKTLYNICHFASGNDAAENDDNDNDNDAGTSTTGGDDDVADEELAKQPRSHSQPSHYGPYDYDIDLINSVLLRGAGCPGVWNANTDSLWVALPPSSLSSSPSPALGQSKIDSKAVESKADQEWLSKLADSVSAYVGGGSGSDGKSIRSNMDQTVRTTRTSANNTVVTKKKVARKKPASDSGDKKDSQDVQDFFAGLLNK